LGNVGIARLRAALILDGTNYGMGTRACRYAMVVDKRHREDTERRSSVLRSVRLPTWNTLAPHGRARQDDRYQ